MEGNPLTPGRLAAACALLLPVAAASAQEVRRDNAIVVTAPGGAIDVDDALTVSQEDVMRGGAPDLLGAMTRKIAGVTLQDAQGDPWQPNLVYRGFVASPLQGQAQGLAVYLDGVRFNQPFGDTVAFDLIPQAAIRSVTLLDASPVYGLNALGGVIVLDTKTGRTDPGIAASATLGRFGYRQAALTVGGGRGDASGLVSLQYGHDGGWRDFSPSTLWNGYADVGVDGEGAGVHMKIVAADTDLTGNGVAPVELLAVARRAIFTAPDITRSRYARVSLHPWLALGSATRIEASLYAQRLRQRTANGDSADIEACGAILCLTDDDGGATPLVGLDGSAIAAGAGATDYAVLNRTAARGRAHGFLAQIIDERPWGAGDNHLAVGVSHDYGRTRFRATTELGQLDEDRFVTGGGPVIAQPDGAITPVGLVARNSYWGLFVQDRLPIADGLSAELGLRWNHADIRLRDRIGTALNGRHRFHRLNAGIEIDYELTDRLALRAGYAENNRAPTPAELSCADETAPCSLTNFFVADPPLKQVVAHSWEAGASGSADLAGWHAQWLLSAYRSTNSDDIQYVASDIRGRAWFRNIGRTRRQGVELTIEARRGGTELSFGYAFTDVRFRTPLVLTSPANPEADDEGLIAVSPGDSMPGIPRHSATLSVDHGGTVGGRAWGVGADFIARSGQYLFGDEANLTRRVPGYVVANLRARIELHPGITLLGEVRNLFDRRFATFGTFSQVEDVELEEAPGASDPRAYGPGAPRRWQIGLSAQF